MLADRTYPGCHDHKEEHVYPDRKVVKHTLIRIHQVFCFLLFDPIEMLRKLRGVPYYLRNRRQYVRLNTHASFRFQWKEVLPVLHDRFRKAGSVRNHYFWQDIWAARILRERKVTQHVDVGSRIDGFVAHVLLFCEVTYVDIRPLDVEVEGLKCMCGSILDLSFVDESISSLSSLHVIEHIGLGRYGDEVNPDGHLQAAAELKRVLAPGGILLVGLPIGRERLCFDGHRIFDPSTVLEMFSPLKLSEFSYIDDRCGSIHRNGSIDDARQCDYGCGLFIFER